MLFPSKHRRQYAEYDQCDDEGDLDDQDGGDADHEGEMLGLMANEEHGSEHGERAAERRPQKQGLFGNTELDVTELGDLLVVEAGDDRADRDDGDVDRQNDP